MRRALVLVIVVASLVGLRALTRPPEPIAVRTDPPPAVPLTAEEHGRELYLRYGCALCHGQDGTGGFANPNSETEGIVPGVIYVAEGYLEEELHEMIAAGTPPIGKEDPEGPDPPYRMPGWGDRMTAAEIDDLVAYLFSLYPEEEDSWR